MALSGTERCDSWHLPSYRYYFSLVCLFTLSPSLSCTLHPLLLSRPQRVGDLERALPQTTLLPTARQGQCVVLRSQASFRLILSSLAWWYHRLIHIYRHLWKPLISKIDGWLLPVTVVITVKSSWVQQPNQLVGRDALLCLFQLATSAIILSWKRSVNNYNYLQVRIRKVLKL